MVEIKYFYERSQEQYLANKMLWSENIHRIFDFSWYQDFNNKTEISIIQDLRSREIEPDILAVRFPHKNILRNVIISRMLIGKGLNYGYGKEWMPKEIWIWTV